MSTVTIGTSGNVISCGLFAIGVLAIHKYKWYIDISKYISCITDEELRNANRIVAYQTKMNMLSFDITSCGLVANALLLLIPRKLGWNGIIMSTDVDIIGSMLKSGCDGLYCLGLGGSQEVYTHNNTIRHYPGHAFVILAYRGHYYLLQSYIDKYRLYCQELTHSDALETVDMARYITNSTCFDSQCSKYWKNITGINSEWTGHYGDYSDVFFYYNNI